MIMKLRAEVLLRCQGFHLQAIRVWRVQGQRQQLSNVGSLQGQVLFLQETSSLRPFDQGSLTKVEASVQLTSLS
jgi:hypothetical protein